MPTLLDLNQGLELDPAVLQASALAIPGLEETSLNKGFVKTHPILQEVSVSINWPFSLK